MAALERTSSIRREEHDRLTGLYNRSAFGQRVDQLLEEYSTGVMFLLDLEHFRLINERYGHRTGDRLLQEVARILRLMVFPDDLLGRVGGDSFAIYMPLEQDTDFLEQRSHQFRERIREIRLPGVPARVTLSVCGCLCQEGDRCEELLRRAAPQLPESQSTPTDRPIPLPHLQQGLEVDLNHIQRDLTMQEQTPGAYCQDYETFQRIYRFVERRLRRSNTDAYILLLTLTNGQGDVPAYAAQAGQMDVLREIIQSSLRTGDLFTQYSTCQFLILLTDLTSEDAQIVSERICTTFYRELTMDVNRLILSRWFPIRTQ